MKRFVSTVVKGVLDVGEKISCPLTLTLFGEEYPAALLSNDGIPYVERRWDGKIIKSEEPRPVDTANVPVVSIRAYNTMVTNNDVEGDHMGTKTRFYRFPYTQQCIHISEEGVKKFDAVTQAGQSVIDLVKSIRDTGVLDEKDLENLEGMVPEVVRHRWKGNCLASEADVRKALGVDDNTPVASMQLIGMWKKSFTTPITRSTQLPSGTWRNVNGRTELESIEPDLFRAHNRCLKELVNDNCEELFESHPIEDDPINVG
jgi:hypothetical protein